MNSASDEAHRAAAAVLKSYRYQDRRMDSLLRGEFERAAELEAKALRYMADTFEFEFPDRDRAREAGERFMVASFMQDEIENWDALQDDPRALERLAVTPDCDRDNLLDDPRWAQVRQELATMCELAGIDPAYVDPKMKFLKFHGVGNPAYEKFAIEAEEIKIRAMIDDANAGHARKLAKYFLKGLERHDQWDNADGVNDATVALGAEYYEKIRSLQRVDEEFGEQSAASARP